MKNFVIFFVLSLIFFVLGIYLNSAVFGMLAGVTLLTAIQLASGEGIGRLVEKKMSAKAANKLAKMSNEEKEALAVRFVKEIGSDTQPIKLDKLRKI